MFAVNSTQLQYLTYTMTDAALGASISIVPERGGIVTSWLVGDSSAGTAGARELFYMDKERFTDPALSVRGGIPVLFPICGNLPDNLYSQQGQTYQLQQHGFARELPWQVVGQQASEQQASVTVALVSSPATKKVYPFDFRVELEYVFSTNRLEIIQRVTNLTEGVSMPFSIGYHPYFAATDKPGLKFQIPSDKYFDKQGTAHPYSGSFDYAAGEIDIVFSDLKQAQVQVTEAGGQTMKMGWTYPNGHVVFWTVPEKDFYCIEPWTARRNAMNTGADLIQVATGETWTHSVDFVLS
jgi:galactose mutarotase-like enzyme